MIGFRSSVPACYPSTVHEAGCANNSMIGEVDRNVQNEEGIVPGWLLTQRHIPWAQAWQKSRITKETTSSTNFVPTTDAGLLSNILWQSMPTPTTQPGRLADPENVALSSLDSESRSSSESTAIEKSGDEEAFLPARQASQEENQHSPRVSRAKLLLWMLANTVATIGIVFTNKSLFSPSLFKHAQLTFASYHFFMTGMLLYALSRPRIGFFELKRAKILEMLPLAAAMCLNVILQNFSLAYSSIPFYQICRVLLTPTVAAINFFLYQKALPRTAVFALVPICLGVGMATYFDALSHQGDDSKKTSLLGVVFAFSGVICSSIYTVWVALYHTKFGMNSMQLLSNQAPLGSALLLYVIPWTDNFPVLNEVPLNGWMLVLLSGLCACAINISQFFIINEAGAVSSTVVGHVKTVSIVTLGWIAGGSTAADGSVVGFLLAISGIITYTTIMLKKKPV